MRPIRRWSQLVTAFLLLACASSTERARRAGALHLHRCVSWATRELARCGTIVVPEHRGSVGGRELYLGVMVLPARGATVEPDPLVFFNGGPGISTTAYAAYASGALDALRGSRDLLLVDMRGTGNDEPLTCDLYENGGRIAPYLQPMFPIARVRECAARLSRRADLAQYTTEAAAQDFDDVRAALHLGQVNLYGASYGSRLALAYMREFPSHVRRAALLGVLPPEAPAGRDFGRGVAQALDADLAECRASARCNSQVPDPRGDIATLLARLRSAPVEVSLWNWRRLSREHITLTARAVAELLWGETYAPGAILGALPLVHRAVAAGDYAPLARRFVRESRSRRSERREGLQLSVLCSEDAPRLTAVDAAADDSSLLGTPVVPELLAACRVWPRGVISPQFTTPVVSAIPTLLISGGRDPVTPHDLADSAARTLSRSERYLDSTQGHAALDDRSRALIADFISRAPD
ncbi:MAG: alpha/beta fold hydrolase [bacterium]